MRAISRRTWPLATLLLVLTTSACVDDDPVRVDDDGDSPYTAATTPDVLIENLVRSYEDLRVDEYERLVSEDMVFFFAPDEIAELGQGPTWDRDQDMLSALAMMLGRAGTNPDGSTQVSIEEIQLQLVEDDPGQPWVTPQDPVFENMLMKRYRVDMVVTFSDRFPGEVTGIHELYVELDAGGPVDVAKADGVYRLKVWRDLGKPLKGPAATAGMTWGQLKATYRFDPPAGLLVTRDDVIDALESSYQNQALSVFEPLLHEDFVFRSWDGIVPGGFFSWLRGDELAVASNMFSGRTGTLPDGWNQSPVETVQIQLTPETDAWTEDVAEQFEGTSLRRFEVAMDVGFADGSSADVTGLQEFYLAPGASAEIEGIFFRTWELRDWRDLGPTILLDAAGEVMTWSKLKQRFREEWTGPPGYPLATSQDQLIENLERAYNERNHAEYDRLLHQDFVFYFAPDEIDDIGQGASWSRAQDTNSAYNMFSSQPGQKPDGTPQAPVQRINLVMLEDDPGAPWTDQVAQEFSGTTMKRFRVEMDVFYTEGNPNEVVGLQEFYAAPVEIDPGDGSMVTVYQIKYWRDLGKNAFKLAIGTGSSSWGSIKARF